MLSIKGYRKDRGLSQQQVADMLKINRVSYNLSESGKRPRKEEEIEQLSQIFDVPISNLIGEHIKAQESISLKNTQKFEDLLLYILTEVGIKPNIGKTVLFKLLYFCDFNYYEKYGKSITGIEYIKLPRGPAPYQFDFIIDQMRRDNKILVVDQEYMGYYQKKYFPNIIIDKNSFSPEEKKIIDDVIENLSNYNASEISEYSHGDIPRIKTPNMENISYELTKERQYPYSVIAREQKKHDDISLISNNSTLSFLLQEQDLYEDLV